MGNIIFESGRGSSAQSERDPAVQTANRVNKVIDKQQHNQLNQLLQQTRSCNALAKERGAEFQGQVDSFRSAVGEWNSRVDWPLNIGTWIGIKIEPQIGSVLVGPYLSGLAAVVYLYSEAADFLAPEIVGLGNLDRNFKLIDQPVCPNVVPDI
jgi:hypothetical protein